MTDRNPLKVALLARSGGARDHLRQALQDLGAELVLEGEPGATDAAALRASGASAVLVSVDSASEHALEQLDDVLLDPSVSVVFDEAETTARLDGWDLARWARHLAAKLVGGSVLPPGGEAPAHDEAALHLEPGIDSTKAAWALNAHIDDYAEEVQASAGTVPSAQPLDDADALGPPPALDADEPAPDWTTRANDESADAIQFSDAELEAFGDLESLSFGDVSSGSADAVSIGDDESFGGDVAMDPELALLAASLDDRFDDLSLDAEPGAGLDFADFDKVAADESSEALPASPRPPVAPDFGFADDPVTAPRVAALSLPDISALSLSDEAGQGDTAAAATPPAPARNFDLSALVLAPLDDEPAAPAPPGRVALDIEAFAPGIAALSLASFGDEPGADGPGTDDTPHPGVVLVLSGIGGPDAVRQLLRGLPLGFPLAVLLQQALDGGRHDRFVEQLAKVSRLPVALAEPHETPPGREVRVLPDGLVAVGAVPLPADPGGRVAAIAAGGGAVVVLSGADELMVPALVAALAEGMHVIVQDPSSCYDASAAQALMDAGAPAVPPTELAARLDACFPS